MFYYGWRHTCTSNTIKLFKIIIWILKPMYSLGKCWKLKISLMGLVYRVVRVLKALWIFLSETINFLRKLHKTNFFGMPLQFYHRVMYIAPSSGHISLNLNMPFKLILRRFEVIFWCLEWECCTFWKIDGNSFKFHQYYTMALKFDKCRKYRKQNTTAWIQHDKVDNQYKHDKINYHITLIQ